MKAADSPAESRAIIDRFLGGNGYESPAAILANKLAATAGLYDLRWVEKTSNLEDLQAVVTWTQKHPIKSELTPGLRSFSVQVKHARRRSLGIIGGLSQFPLSRWTDLFEDLARAKTKGKATTEILGVVGALRLEHYGKVTMAAAERYLDRLADGDHNTPLNWAQVWRKPDGLGLAGVVSLATDTEVGMRDEMTERYGDDAICALNAHRAIAFVKQPHATDAGIRAFRVKGLNHVAAHGWSAFGDEVRALV